MTAINRSSDQGESSSYSHLDPSERTALLRRLLDKPEELMLPGVHDALTARIAEARGWPVIYLGSYSTTAIKYAAPDSRIIGLSDIAEKSREIMAATMRTPLIVDAEGGFGDSTTIWKTMEVLEASGVSGLHIEDGVFGKHLPVQGEVLEVDEMRRRISGLLDARQNEDVLVIARTDCAWLSGTGGVSEALRRAEIYADTGADMVFVCMVEDSLLEQHPVLSEVPLCTVDWSPILDPDRASGVPGRLRPNKRLNVRIRILYSHILHAVYSAVGAMLDEIPRGITSSRLVELGMIDDEVLQQFLGVNRIIDHHTSGHSS